MEILNFSKLFQRVDKVKFSVVIFVFIIAVFAIFNYKNFLDKELTSIQFFPQIETRKRMCDWNCTKEGNLLLYSEVVTRTKICEPEKKITRENEELNCTLLGAFLRSQEEIKDMCQRNWVICPVEKF